MGRMNNSTKGGIAATATAERSGMARIRRGQHGTGGTGKESLKTRKGDTLNE